MTDRPPRRLAGEFRALLVLYTAIAVLPMLLGWCSS